MSRSEKQRVLLVDDDDATCTLITALLQHEFDVEIAGDGREAIEKLRTTLFSCILLDLLMPGTDGFAVLDFLRSTNPQLLRSVVVVTAAVSPLQLNRARGYGVAAVISKPFDVETLLGEVKNCAAEGGTLGTVFCTSTPMILLLADLLRQRLL